jgi:Protein of unknown function (DUF4199)
MDEKPTPSIVSIATKYGVISAVLAFVVLLVQAAAHLYTSRLPAVINIVILIVLMVLAHREYKNTHGRMMTYAQGLGSGTLLATIAAVVGCILTLIYVKFINTGYLPAVLHAQQLALQQRGITAAQAQQAMAITGFLLTPVGLAVSSLISGVIVGFIVALIVSIFTQKGDPRVVV